MILQVNNDKTFALNFSDKFSVNRGESRDIKLEEHYYDFAKGVGLKGYERFFFPNFAHRMQHALPRTRAVLWTCLENVLIQSSECSPGGRRRGSGVRTGVGVEVC